VALTMYSSDPMYELKINQEVENFECTSIKVS